MSILMLRNGDGTITPQKPSIGPLVLDASLSEVHTYNSQVPQYPTEQGFSVSDNIYNQPIQVSITGIVSTTPLQGDLTPDPTRADRAYRDMIQIRDNKETITIVTPINVYDDMAMTSLVIPRNRATGESFEFTASFTQILKADVKVITIERINPTVPRAQVQIANFINGGKALVTKVAQKKAEPFVSVFNGLRARFGR
jgi:hypothetical protein